MYDCVKLQFIAIGRAKRKTLLPLIEELIATFDKLIVQECIMI